MKEKAVFTGIKGMKGIDLLELIDECIFTIRVIRVISGLMSFAATTQASPDFDAFCIYAK